MPGDFWRRLRRDLRRVVANLILITAATGQVGREVVAELVRRGERPRALVRDVSRSPANAEVTEGSFEDDASLARALRSVDVLFLAGRDSPDAVAQHRRVLEHARGAGVQHVVKLSALGASPTSPVGLMRDHHEVVEEVRRGPWSWTLLRPHLYMQNLLRAADAGRVDGRLEAPMGDGRYPLVDTARPGPGPSRANKHRRGHFRVLSSVEPPTARLRSASTPFA